MRYAVVIEKADGNIRPMCRTCRAASRPGQRSRIPSAKSAMRSAFISMVCEQDGQPIPQPTSIADYVEA